MEGKALHAKADTLETEQEKQKAITEAYKAASNSVQWFRTLREEQKDKIMYAETLLLYANSAARFVRECPSQAPSSNDGIIETAKQNVHEALRILTALNHPTTGNAYRVLGVIEHHWTMSRPLGTSKTIQTIMAPWRILSDLGRVRQCGVPVCSFILEHITLKAEPPHARIWLPWLEKATILHTEIGGEAVIPTPRNIETTLSNWRVGSVSTAWRSDRLTLSDEDTAAFLKHF